MVHRTVPVRVNAASRLFTASTRYRGPAAALASGTGADAGPSCPSPSTLTPEVRSDAPAFRGSRTSVTVAPARPQPPGFTGTAPARAGAPTGTVHVPTMAASVSTRMATRMIVLPLVRPVTDARPGRHRWQRIPAQMCRRMYAARRCLPVRRALTFRLSGSDGRVGRIRFRWQLNARQRAQSRRRGRPRPADLIERGTHDPAGNLDRARAARDRPLQPGDRGRRPRLLLRYGRNRPGDRRDPGRDRGTDPARAA